MHYQIYLLLLAFVIPTLATSQVVNTEKLRRTTNKKWVTELDANVGLTRNRAGQTVRVGIMSRLEYQREQSGWMLLGSYDLTQFDDIDDPDGEISTFVNRSLGHLRYNYITTDWLTMEAFSQVQFNEVQEIKVRVLHGLGPRFQLIRNDSLQLFLGSLYMYEYEETDETEVLVFNKDHRLSSYLSCGVQLKSYLILNHVTYYQPNLQNWSDYRISTETSISVQVNKHIALSVGFELVYDTVPPLTVPRAMYSLRNGITATF
ncbi:MAG: DUF481 domain-containing protein [Bacteroidota bacterium]